MIITNPARKGGGKRSRARSFFGSIANRLMEDGKNAAAIYLGSETGKVAEELGFRYLAGTAGRYTTPVSLVGGWFLLRRFVKGAFGRYMGLGLLARAIEYGASQAGISPSSQLMAILPGASSVPSSGTATSGMGLISRDNLQTRLSGVGNPYMRAYGQPY